MACFGQNKDALKDISSVTFYGIDFTRAKVYGAKEGPMQFKYTFDDINKLFITEPKKYDIGKRLGVNVEVTSLEAVNDANKTINPDEIMTTNSGYTPVSYTHLDVYKRQVLGNPPDLHLGDLSLENVKSVLEQYLIGSIIFAMACSLLSGVISTVLLAICRRKNGYD